MNEQELRQKIDMFFKGELSDTEEQGLRDYLATHEVPEDFIQEKRIILSLIPDSLHTYCVTGIAKQRESIKDNIIDIKPPILLIPPFFSPINPYTIIIPTNNILISIFLLSFLLNVKKQTKINSDSCLHKFTLYFVVTSYFNVSISEVRNEVKLFY